MLTELVYKIKGISILTIKFLLFINTLQVKVFKMNKKINESCNTSQEFVIKIGISINNAQLFKQIKNHS